MSLGEALVEAENIRRGVGVFDTSMPSQRLIALGDVALDDWDARSRAVELGVLSALATVCSDGGESFLRRGLAARALGNLASDTKARQWISERRIPALGSLVALASSDLAALYSHAEASDIFMIRMHCYFAIAVLTQQDFGKNNRAAELREMMIEALAASGTQFARAHKQVQRQECSSEVESLSSILDRSIGTPQTPSSLFETMRSLSKSRPATPAELILAASLHNTTRPTSASEIRVTPSEYVHKRPVSSFLLRRRRGDLPPITPPKSPLSTSQRPGTALLTIEETQDMRQHLDLNQWGFLPAEIAPPPNATENAQLSSHLARPSTSETAHNRLDTAEARVFYSILSTIASNTGTGALRNEFHHFLSEKRRQVNDVAKVEQERRSLSRGSPSPYAALPLGPPKKKRRARRKRVVSNRVVHQSRLYAAPLITKSPNKIVLSALVTSKEGESKLTKPFVMDARQELRELNDSIRSNILTECNNLPIEFLERLKGSGIAAQYAAQKLRHLEKKVATRYAREALHCLRTHARMCAQREFDAKRKRERVLASLRLMQKIIRQVNASVQAKLFARWTTQCDRQRRSENNAGAIVIQSAWRRQLGIRRAAEEMLRQIQLFLVTSCQAIFRGRVERRRYKALRDSVKVLQKYFRDMLHILRFRRAVVAFVRLNHSAASTIQKMVSRFASSAPVSSSRYCTIREYNESSSTDSIGRSQEDSHYQSAKDA